MRWAMCLVGVAVLFLHFFFVCLCFFSTAEAFDGLKIKVHDVLLRMFIVIIRICVSDRNGTNSQQKCFGHST